MYLAKEFQNSTEIMVSSHVYNIAGEGVSPGLPPIKLQISAPCLMSAGITAYYHTQLVIS